jgi:hypothetical protein
MRGSRSKIRSKKISSSSVARSELILALKGYCAVRVEMQYITAAMAQSEEVQSYLTTHSQMSLYLPFAVAKFHKRTHHKSNLSLCVTLNILRFLKKLFWNKPFMYRAL